MKTVSLLLLFFISIILSAQDLQKAKILFDEKKYAQAKAELEKIVDKDSKNHEAYFYLGRSYAALREFDEASDAFEEAVDLNETNAEYHFWLAQAYAADALNSNVFSQALLAPKIKNEFLRTVELDKNHVPARVGLIDFYSRAPGIMGGSMEKAFENARRLVKIDDKRGRVKLTELYLKEKKLKEADREFAELENKYGNDSLFYSFYNSYGYALMQAGRIDDAIIKFKKQVELAPDKANPHDSLGEAYMAAGKKAEAREQFKKALAIDPDFEASKRNLKKLDSGK